MAQDYAPFLTASDADSATISSRGLFGEMVSNMTNDMRFVGLFSIVYGALACLTIVGALIGVPYIIMGLRLRNAADGFDQFDASSDREALRRAFEKQRSYFFINKVLIIIGLVLFALYIALVVFVVGVGIFSGMEGSSTY